jgi:hypothetical protein
MYITSMASAHTFPDKLDRFFFIILEAADCNMMPEYDKE